MVTCIDNRIKKITEGPESLVVFPEEGVFLRDLVGTAQKELIVSSQVLPSKSFCDLLISLHRRNIDVKVLLSDPKYFSLYEMEEIAETHSVDKDIISYSSKKLPRSEKHLYYLNNAGIYPHFINHDKYMLNHAKYFVVDGKYGFIGSSVDSRNSKIDLGLLFTESERVDFLTELFFCDYFNYEKNLESPKNILFSPNTMREEIQSVIDNAEHSITIIATAITDDDFIYKQLENKLFEGIKLYVLFSPHLFSIESHNHKSVADHFYNLRLKKLGAHLRMVYDPVIHCKCVIVDHDCAKRGRVYVGSANLRTSSLDSCREVGAISDHRPVIDKAMELFATEWDRGVDYQ